MKLLMITTLLASLLVSTDATVVKAYKGTACKKDNYIGSVSACGSTGLSQNYKVQSLSLNFQKATASFYQQKPDRNGNCVGPRISKNSDQTLLGQGFEKYLFYDVNLYSIACFCPLLVPRWSISELGRSMYGSSG
ncbi:hypothetical protein PCH_Pc20g11490 [Penicillium rubens Wisconsin 54-1255]|uniref:Secreted protein n=1 Tax=Penicillium rubens (strain ATCC 28089 / DSM 1075 / NRRL 1951 / Wisconsin 54-1255) TaxID=500485 RepID=B6HG83_PENRW|nr:hypothetical protein PCH_Pc20g11490 [Penicillium rubens Wisconsin 54-1255]